MKDPRDLEDIPKKYLSSLPKESIFLKDKQELSHYRNILSAFLCYKNYSIFEFNNKIKDLKLIDSELLKYSITKKQEDMYNCININYNFLYDCIIDELEIFPYNNEENKYYDNYKLDIKTWTKMKGLFGQIIRDWTSDGQKEREETYSIIISKLKEIYKNPNKAYVLVPVI